MPETGIDSAVTRESELVPLIDSIVTVWHVWMAVISGLNRIRVGRFLVSSSNVGKFYA